MAPRFRKAPLTTTEHAITQLWDEFWNCAHINADHKLEPPTKLVGLCATYWDAAPFALREQTEARIDAAGAIIDLYKTGRITVAQAASRIQCLFST